MYETFVQSDGASTYVCVEGERDAPAILILDGIGCTGWAFRRIIPRLREHHRVVLMHYRGHGRSPEPPTPWNLGMHDLADDAAEVLRTLEIDRAALVGFSMGFQVALELYKRHRARVRALVSIAGPPGHCLEQFQGTEVFAQLLPLVRAATHHAQELTLKLWRRVLPSRFAAHLGLLTQLNADRIPMPDFEFYLSQMAAMNPELFVEMLQEAARHTTEDVLSQIRVPTLVMAGQHDRFVPLPVLRRVAFTIPQAEWVVFAKGTHALPAEFAREITDHVLRFLSEHPA